MNHNRLLWTKGDGWSRLTLAICAASVGFAVVVGIRARVAGLGFSSLAVDEYYFVQSIRRIIETGVPLFETGGYYTRGILIQYLTAPSMMLAGSEELGVRIPSVIFGLLTIVVSYLYGRRVLGNSWALALAVLLLLSSWQIEFSRFGRMYAGFQFASMAMILALHDTMGNECGRRLYFPHVICFLSLLTHQLAAVLVPLLFLPLITPGLRHR